MKLFHPRYSGIDVGLGGKQYRVERAGSGAYVNVPEAIGHLLFEHGFRKVEAIDIEALAREASTAREAEESVNRGAARKALFPGSFRARKPCRPNHQIRLI